MEIIDLKDKHKDEDIYIIGEGATGLSEDLNHQTTIGVDYAFYLLKPTYIVTRTPVIFTSEIDSIKIIQSEKPEIELIHRSLFEDVIYSLSASVSPNNSKETVLMGDNAFLAAMHLAYIMGAKRIIPLGCAAPPFYYTDSEKIVKNTHSLMKRYNSDIVYGENQKRRYLANCEPLEFIQSLNDLYLSIVTKPEVKDIEKEVNYLSKIFNDR